MMVEGSNGDVSPTTSRIAVSALPTNRPEPKARATIAAAMGELLLTTINPSGASGQGCGALWSFTRSGFRFIEAGTIAASVTWPLSSMAWGHRKESSMNSVQVEQKSYEMPPKEGISIAQFLTVADIERSARWYEKVFDARILSLGDGNAPGYLQLANIWMILNVGGGPTPDKPTVTLSVPDPNHINSFMNLRVADIQACYKLWKSRGAEFITEPIPKYGEIRCYMRDPDGYIIEVGQSTDLTYG
jgi:catechol 2,3-dioxygenase-like lactoylglutathione lyase family enzyme